MTPPVRPFMSPSPPSSSDPPAAHGFELRPRRRSDRRLLLAEVSDAQVDAVRAALASAGVEQTVLLQASATSVEGQLAHWIVAPTEPSDFRSIGGIAWNSVNSLSPGAADLSVGSAMASSLEITVVTPGDNDDHAERVILPAIEGGQLRIGRDPSWADHRIAHPQVSGRHLTVGFTGGRHVLTDHRSTCGTVVNDRAAKPGTGVPLEPDAVIRIGEGVTMVYRDLSDLFRQALASAPPPSAPNRPQRWHRRQRPRGSWRTRQRPSPSRRRSIRRAPATPGLAGSS